MLVLNTTRRALFNGMPRFCIAETMILKFVIVSSMTLKNITYSVMKNLSTSFDRVRRVVLEIRMERF